MYNQSFSQTVRMTLWGIAFICLLLFTVHANAQLPSSVDEASVGIGINQLPGTPISWSGNAAVPFGNDDLGGFAAAILQSNGTVTRGRVHAEIGKDLGAIRAEVYTDGTVRGKDIGDLGHDFSSGINAVVPLGNLELKLGIAGRSGGAFAKPNLFDLGAANGYDENYLEGFTHTDGNTLATTNPAATSVGFQNRNSLVLRGAIEVDLPAGISGEFIGMPELTGSSKDADSEALDQLIINLNKNYALSDTFFVQAGLGMRFQRGRDSGDVGNDIATRISVNTKF